MNTSEIEKIANAILYEGYVLYPYRASAAKNRQRFNFGVLYPPQYCALNPGSDDWRMQTECLVMGNDATTFEVKVRFLQMGVRPGPNHGADWQEGIERDVSTLGCSLESIARRPLRQRLMFHAGADSGDLRTERTEGELDLRAARLDEGLYRISLHIHNCSILENPRELSRDDVLLRSMIAVHSILHAEGGRFLSAMDPPEPHRAAVQECQNIGTWPVLAGEEGRTDLMLSSPIILYDYPQIAAESPGDLCDGLEIDEILALRILTMTDEEKREVREGDERARRILERTERLPPEHFQKLHGALRALRESQEEAR